MYEIEIDNKFITTIQTKEEVIKLVGIISSKYCLFQ